MASPSRFFLLLRMGVFLSWSCVHPHTLYLSDCGCVYSLCTPCPLSVSEPVRWALQCTGGDRLAPNESIWDRLGEVCLCFTVSVCVSDQESWRVV